MITRRGMFTASTGLALFGASQSVGSSSVAAGDGERLSARDFGAVGDGVADDTAALQKIFAAALDGADARMIVIPPGRYKVSKTIEVVTSRKPNGNVTRRSGISAQGALLVSTISNGSPIIRIESRATLRYFLIEGLQIKGSGRDGAGIAVSCQMRGAYFYNFCLRDVVVEGCGGDGCQLVGNIFEGQIINCYFRDNKKNGATFSHGAENTVFSAVHVMGCVFGQNGVHGVEMSNGAMDVGFFGCYFLLNRQYGLTASHGVSLLSHCGFENNHQGAPDFAHGDAGMEVRSFATLVGCTAYSIYNQTHLVKAWIASQLTLVGCTADGGGKAKGARLAKIAGRAGSTATIIGSSGGVDRGENITLTRLGDDGAGVRFGGEWSSPDLMRLGHYSLWVDGGGRLRIKRGAPMREDDGQIVGT